MVAAEEVEAVAPMVAEAPMAAEAPMVAEEEAMAATLVGEGDRAGP
jgi:hypothetical protein